MNRGNMRQPSPGMGSRGHFRSPTADNGGRQSFGSPRYGQFMGSPNTPPMGYRGGYGGSSPAHTPYRPMGSDHGGSPYRNYSPYHSPGQRMPYQGSPRSSTPYGSRGRGRGREEAAGVEKYYSPKMVQDPWASLQPVAANSNAQSTHTGGGRYY